MLKFKTAKTLNTAGDGYWSDRAAPVLITHMNIAYLADDEEFGELRVYFPRTSWNVNQHGLIYTDRLWMSELRALLDSLGYDSSDVGYSEQGMQGENYVSLDVGDKFISSWNKKHRVTV